MNLQRRHLLCALAAMVCAPSLHATGLETITGPEAAQALRETLTQGAKLALTKLGAENGYFGRPEVKIGLPPKLLKAEGVLRSLGQGKKVDDLVLAMNRAAEAAAPKAETLVLNAVKNLSAADAKTILAGGDGAATAYFRKATEAELGAQLMPVIKGVTEKSNLARAYNTLAAKLRQLAGLKSDLSTVEDYVNRRALDGIYSQIAVEEHAIRSNPGQYAGDLLGKVLGLLK